MCRDELVLDEADWKVATELVVEELSLSSGCVTGGAWAGWCGESGRDEMSDKRRWG